MRQGDRVRDLLPGDLELFLKQHGTELQIRLHELGLQDSHRNGQVLLRYLRDHQDLEITVETIFGAVNAPGYREYLEFVPAGPAEPEPVTLSVTAKQIKQMDREQYKALRYSFGADRVGEVDAAITAIVSGAPSDEKIATGADRLYQLGIRVDSSRPDRSKQLAAQTANRDSLEQRRRDYDIARHKIDMIEVTNPVVGRLDHGATAEAKKLALRVLGERP